MSNIVHSNVNSRARATVLVVAVLCGSALPASAQAPSPTATPTLAPQCVRPDVPPTTVRARPPALPKARLDGYRPAGTVVVALTLDANSNVTAAEVRTGDEPLRDAALATARNNDYRTEIRGCSPVAGTYLYVVDYQRPPLHRCALPPVAVPGEEPPPKQIGCIAVTVGDP